MASASGAPSLSVSEATSSISGISKSFVETSPKSSVASASGAPSLSVSEATSSISGISKSFVETSPKSSVASASGALGSVISLSSVTSSIEDKSRSSRLGRDASSTSETIPSFPSREISSLLVGDNSTSPLTSSKSFTSMSVMSSACAISEESPRSSALRFMKGTSFATLIFVSGSLTLALKLLSSSRVRDKLKSGSPFGCGLRFSIWRVSRYSASSIEPDSDWYKSTFTVVWLSFTVVSWSVLLSLLPSSMTG